MEEPSSERQVARFEAWLHADPAHLKVYQGSADIARRGEGLSMRRAAVVSLAPPSSRLRPAFALVAASLLVVFGIFLLARGASPAFAAIVNHSQAIRTVALRDGTTVILDTATDLQVPVAGKVRQLRLLSGRARFAVHPGELPFEVKTGAGTISASDCLIDVAWTNNEMRVALIRGQATLSTTGASGPNGRVDLRRGEIVRLHEGEATTAHSSPQDLSWPKAHIGFDDTPLARILAIADRSESPKIVVASETTGALRVTGVLDLRDNRKLAHQLAAALDLRVVDRADTLLLEP